MKKTRRGRMSSPAARRIVVAAPVAATVVVAASALGLAPAHAAGSSFNVVDASNKHVTADALPTAQIDNGVVWTTAISGDTVYAGGEFSNARPAGAAAGTSLVPRSNIMAFSLSTGVMTDFAPVVNGTVRSLAFSPDQSVLYIGGDFSQVNGQPRSNIAAINVATGALLPFAPTVNSTVKAIQTKDNMVYIGGNFTNVNGFGRAELAAVNTAGTLTSWAPTADYVVDGLALTPDQSRVIVAGAFQKINGVTNPGIAAVDATTGTVYPYAANRVVQNYGTDSAIYSVKSDGTSILATAYNYSGSGNYEGVLRLDPNTGNIIWMADCHGDSYNATSLNGDIYSVSHHHDCSNINSQPQQNPWAYQRADSWTYGATGTVGKNNDAKYHDFKGQPAPSEYDWFPTLTPGTYTGATQAAWTASASNDYLVLGGEFPSVNGQAQYGLVRFTTQDKAPNAQGPMSPTNSFTPTLSVVNGTNVKVTWPTTYDRDQQTLNYKVVRSDQTSAIWSGDFTTQWWNKPNMSYLDAGLQPNTSYTYKIKITDKFNNTRYSATATVTTAATGTAFSPYMAKVVNENPAHYWPMNEKAGTSKLADYGTLNQPLTARLGVTMGAAGMNSETAGQFNGGSLGQANTTSTAETGPQNFAIETWIKTTSTSGGKIVGFGKTSWLTTNADRHVYMTNAGKLVFGVYPNKTTQTITSPNSYNDGQWHYVVAQLSSAGMQLFVDNQQVANNPDVTTAESNTGNWHLGGDTLAGWPSRPSSDYFKGAIDDTSIYYSPLSLAQMKAHYVASGRSATNIAPTASLSATCNDAGVCNAVTTANDPDGSITKYAWTVDGVKAAGTSASNSFTLKNGTHHIAVTVTDDSGATTTASQDVTVTIPNKAPTASFTSTTRALTANLDASASTDTDGTVASYAWDFGDGSTGTGKTASHAYAKAGEYTVTLTTTDDQGATSTTSQDVTVGDIAPTASFTTSNNQLTAKVDASASKDADGSIVSYDWDFGDSTTATGKTATHTYGTSGTYTITLTTTDDLGATTTTTKQITVVDAGPVASFTSTVKNLDTSFDATGTTDTTGAALTDYAWDFGDGSTGTGATPTHSYTSAGTWTVTLTVTDANGEKSTTTDTVTTQSPIVAQDDFAGTRTNWGTPTVGGKYTYSKASAFTTANTAGVMKMTAAGQGLTNLLSDTNASQLKFTGAFSTDKIATGGGTYAYLVARHTADGEYRMAVHFMPDGSVRLGGIRVQGSTVITLKEVTVPGLTYTAGQAVNVEFQLTGTTAVTITGSAWTDTRPASPALSVTDNTVVAQSGQVGFMGYLSGSSTNAPVGLSVSPYTIERLA